MYFEVTDYLMDFGSIICILEIQVFFFLNKFVSLRWQLFPTVVIPIPKGIKRDLEEEWRLFPRTGSMIPFVVESWGLCELSEGSEALSRRRLCVQSLRCGFYGLQPPSVKSQTFMPQNPSLEFKPLISRT